MQKEAFVLICKFTPCTQDSGNLPCIYWRHRIQVLLVMIYVCCMMLLSQLVGLALVSIKSHIAESINLKKSIDRFAKVITC